MRLQTLTRLALIFVSVLASSLQAEPPSAKIQDAAWISGHWQGQALGGFCDEQWSKPMAGAMMGMFRLIKDDKIVFYEFFRLAEESGSLMLRLKHFHADLKGWEQKDDTVTFPLVKIGPGELIFEGMTFRRTSPDEILVTVMIGSRSGGAPREEKFVYKRAKESLTAGE
jgi:hypothetical protein